MPQAPSKPLPSRNLLDSNFFYTLPPAFPSPSFDTLRSAAEAPLVEPTPPVEPAAPMGLADLARVSGRGIEAGAATGRTFTGADIPGAARGVQVRGHPSGKLWFDEQRNQWRPLAELPPGYTVIPPKVK